MEPITLVINGRNFDNIAAGMQIVGDAVEAGVDGGMTNAPSMLMRGLRAVADRVRQDHSGSWNGSVFNNSDRLQSRTGRGIKSIYDSVKLLDGGSGGSGGSIVSAQITTGTMSIHETGGTIRASGSGYLTIPLPAAMDLRGVPLRQRARDWDNTFVKRSKKGNLIIFRSLPGANELTPLYILKREVYIKPRLFLEPKVYTQMGYFDSKLWERISDIIDRRLP